MRKHFFNIICLLITLVILKPHATAIPATNWEAILKPVEYLQGNSSWGKQQGKGGDDDDDRYSNDDDDDSSEIPLDGGLGFLAAAGAGLGIKKLRDNRAKKKAGHSSEQ